MIVAIYAISWNRLRSLMNLKNCGRKSKKKSRGQPYVLKSYLNILLPFVNSWVMAVMKRKLLSECPKLKEHSYHEIGVCRWSWKFGSSIAAPQLNSVLTLYRDMEVRVRTTLVRTLWVLHESGYARMCRHHPPNSANTNRIDLLECQPLRTLREK
jgi:hypothetical protein